MIPKPQVITDLLQYGMSSTGSMSVPRANAGVASSPAKKLEALDASVTLAIDGSSSSATVRLPKGEGIDGRTYVEMFTIQGSAGVFRTRSPQIGYGGQYTNLQLEHAVNEIGDYIIPDRFEKKMTLKNAMKKIFSYYTPKSLLWQLGTVEAPDDPDNDEDSSEECVLDVDYDNCLDAIRGVIDQYPFMYLDFNFAVRPWKLNVRNKPTTVTAEGRLSRNVASATVTRDDSELFTRVYMAGYKKNVDANGYGCYTSKWASGKYGLIETVITGANDTPEIAERTVKNFLHTHKKPRYNITIDGIELSTLTGEKLDKFTIAKLMRLALPDYGTTVTKHITGLSFPSVYKSPNSVTVSLEDEPNKVIKYIKDAQKIAKRAGGAAKKVADEAYIGATVKNGILYLTRGDGTVVNFSKAVTLYKDSAHRAGWSGGTFTVRAYQTNLENGKEVGKEVAVATTSIGGIRLQAGKSPTLSGTYNLYVPLKVTYGTGNPGAGSADTGYTEGITVSALPVYNKGRSKGWDEAYKVTKVPQASSSSTMTVKVPSETIGREAEYDYTVSILNPRATNSTAVIKNAVGTTVASCSNPSYGYGWSAARDMVDPPSSGTSASMTFGVPAVTVGDPSSYDYTVSIDNEYAYIKNAANRTVARVENDTYKVTVNQISFSGVGNSPVSGSGRNAGRAARVDGASYVNFTISVHGLTQQYYISLY